MYFVDKTYPHSLGLSACFRQHAASSHCRWLHGYPLEFRLRFAAAELDYRNWVIDFGGLKPVKEWLCLSFDHKLVIASDDPRADELAALAGIDCADTLILPAVGCEAFAKYVYDYVQRWLSDGLDADRVQLVEVECREHGGNAAIYRGHIY